MAYLLAIHCVRLANKNNFTLQYPIQLLSHNNTRTIHSLTHSLPHLTGIVWWWWLAHILSRNNIINLKKLLTEYVPHSDWSLLIYICAHNWKMWTSTNHPQTHNTGTFSRGHSLPLWRTIRLMMPKLTLVVAVHAPPFVRNIMKYNWIGAGHAK